MELGIDKDRKERYKQKIKYSREKIYDLEDWLENRDELSIMGSEKAFQEAVEAIMDIFAMFLSDLGLEIGDNYNNAEKVAKRGLINKKEKEICFEANGLRNRVVHKYNNLKEDKFISSAKRLIQDLQKILNKIEVKIEDG